MCSLGWMDVVSLSMEQLGVLSCCAPQDAEKKDLDQYMQVKVLLARCACLCHKSSKRPCNA